MLFDQGKLTGYIDFDLSQKDARIFNICYFLMGLLSEGHREKEDQLSIKPPQEIR